MRKRFWYSFVSQIHLLLCLLSVGVAEFSLKIRDNLTFSVYLIVYNFNFVQFGKTSYPLFFAGSIFCGMDIT